MIILASFYCFLFSEWRTPTHYLLSRIKSESFDLSALGSQECRWNSSAKVVYRSLSPAAKPAIRSALSLCILLWVQSKWSLCHYAKKSRGNIMWKERRKFPYCVFFSDVSILGKEMYLKEWIVWPLRNQKTWEQSLRAILGSIGAGNKKWCAKQTTWYVHSVFSFWW